MAEFHSQTLETMNDRRLFLKSSLMIGAGAASISSAVAKEKASDLSSGYDYKLPKFSKGDRLLFIGDSITDMNWGRNEKDRNHYLGHSYVYLIAARLGVEMPHAKLEFFNRGHSGNRISDLKRRWQKDVIEMKPNLLSILIGVNDRKVKEGQKFSSEQWEADYRDLLTKSRQSNKDVRLVLIDPFVLKSGWWMTKGGEWNISRTQIESMGKIVAKLAKEFRAVHVKMQEVFDLAARDAGPEQWIWDGVHPLPQGHELIARQWLQQLSSH